MLEMEIEFSALKLFDLHTLGKAAPPEMRKVYVD